MQPLRAALPLIAILIAAPVLAQSPRGTWEGFAYTGGSSQQVTIVLDSAAGGWKGAASSPTVGDAIPLVTVALKADTLSFGIPYNGMTVWINGLVSGAKFNGQIWVNNDNAGTMELTRKAEAAEKPAAKP
jgi:hypothetical protein